MATNSRDYARAHYEANKAAYKRRARRWTAKTILENRRRVDAYLQSHPCVDCGESDYVVLEFDHVRGRKRLEVSTLANRGCAWRTIQAEIDKCEVRCANCHRRQTVTRGRAAAARNPHKVEVEGSIPSPATFLFDAINGENTVVM
jgi:hypothetical protein